MKTMKMAILMKRMTIVREIVTRRYEEEFVHLFLIEMKMEDDNNSVGYNATDDAELAHKLSYIKHMLKSHINSWQYFAEAIDERASYKNC